MTLSVQVGESLGQKLNSGSFHNQKSKKYESRKSPIPYYNIYYILSVALYSKFSKCSMRIAVLHSIGMSFTGQSKKLIWFPLFAYPKKYPNSNWILPHRRLDSSNEITCSQVYLKSIYLKRPCNNFWNNIGKHIFLTYIAALTFE